jgi:hypothetical protein
VLSTPLKTQAFLRNLPLFRELAEAEIDRVAAGTRELRVKRSDILFQKGDPSRGFHVVVYGQVKLLFITPQGDEKVIEIMGPGQSFGEAIMFMDKPYPVTAQALVDSMLLHVAREVVFEEIDRDPKFAHRMIAGLSMRLHHLIIDVEYYSISTHSGHWPFPRGDAGASMDKISQGLDGLRNLLPLNLRQAKRHAPDDLRTEPGHTPIGCSCASRSVR